LVLADLVRARLLRRQRLGRLIAAAELGLKERVWLQRPSPSMARSPTSSIFTATGQALLNIANCETPP
jgi:hypothetical protein